MRKEFIICIIIIIIVIAANTFTQMYTKNAVDFINNKLEELKQQMLKENVKREIVQEKINNIINKEWRKKYDTLAFFTEHDELEKVETELTSLKSHIEIEQYDDGIPELEKAQFILNHIKEKFKLDIKNIF